MGHRQASLGTPVPRTPTPAVSVKIGDHCYHGLCDLGARVSAIPFSLYQEIKYEIAPAEIEDIDVTIKHVNRDTISPCGIIRDVEVLCGKIKYPTDFLVLGTPQDDFCPIIFGRLMTHKYRGSIVVLSISKSVEPNEEQKEMISGFQQGILYKYRNKW